MENIIVNYESILNKRCRVLIPHALERRKEGKGPTHYKRERSAKERGALFEVL